MTSNSNHALNCILREARDDYSVLVSRSCVCAGACGAGFASLLLSCPNSTYLRPQNDYMTGTTASPIC